MSKTAEQMKAEADAQAFIMDNVYKRAMFHRLQSQHNLAPQNAREEQDLLELGFALAKEGHLQPTEEPSRFSRARADLSAVGQTKAAGQDETLAIAYELAADPQYYHAALVAKQAQAAA